MIEEETYWVVGPFSDRGPLNLTDLERAAKFGNLCPDTQVRLANGEIRQAKDLGEFDYLPRSVPKFPTTQVELCQLEERTKTRWLLEYLVASWMLLFLGFFALPILFMPLSFVFGVRSFNLGSRTAWIPALCSGLSFVVVATLAIQKSWSVNPF